MDRPLARGLSLQDVERARTRIAGTVRRTPLVRSESLTGMVGAPVYLKLENQQLTGSFKLRGALNAVLALSEHERAKGVVTVSTGNHGRAVAYACRQIGVRTVVCMSRLVPANKLAAIEELGAEVRICGSSQDEAQREADRLVSESGLTLVPPFDNADVIAGQATIGAEILEQLPAVRRVLVPLSGGGLISGIALALKTMGAAAGADAVAEVVGVSLERGCAMYESQRAGHPVEVEELETLADSLGGGIGLDNRFTFRMVRDLVDRLELVGEDEIADAIVHLHRFEGQVVEGAAAVGVARLLAERSATERSMTERSMTEHLKTEHLMRESPTDGETASTGATVVVISGGNIDPAAHAGLVAQSQEGRPAR